MYCDAEFSEADKASKDHIPSYHGRGDWALNIVLTCRSCDCSRGNIPFRTYCRLSSPIQNRHILRNFQKRVVAIDHKSVDEEAFACFADGLAVHDPKHYRYTDICKRGLRRDGMQSETVCFQRRLYPF